MNEYNVFIDVCTAGFFLENGMILHFLVFVNTPKVVFLGGKYSAKFIQLKLYTSHLVVYDFLLLSTIYYLLSTVYCLLDIRRIIFDFSVREGLA